MHNASLSSYFVTILLLCCALGAQSGPQAYIKASNSETLDFFGRAVSLSADTLVVGTSREGSNATGVNGDQNNNSALGAGAAYVFVRSGTTWRQQAYLKASNTDAYDGFGASVAVSGDTIVVGAPWERSNARGVNGDQSNNTIARAGAAYVFVRNGTTWTQQAYLKASNTVKFSEFGCSVAVFGDTIVVGAEEIANASGAVCVFVRSGTTWSQQAYVVASNPGNWDRFGATLSLWEDTLVVGAWAEDSSARGVNGWQGDSTFGYDSGAAYVFVRNGATWSQQAYLKASNTGSADYFGGAVAICKDIVVVGAIHEASSATGVNGNGVNNNLAYSGAAYVFERSGTTWSWPVYLKASNTGGGDRFGKRVAVSDGVVLVSSHFEESDARGFNGDQNDNSAYGAGAVYVFGQTRGSWAQRNYLKASNTDAGDFFGVSITMSGDTAVIGADWEGSNARGINGDQSNNSAGAAGAVYVYTNPDTPRAWYKNYGRGCGSGLTPPQTTLLAAPRLGDVCTLRVTPLVQGTAGVLLLGFSDKLWGGVTLPLDLSFLGMNGCELLASWDLQVGFVAPAGGGWDLPLALPSNAALEGLRFFSQAWVLDRPANALGVGTSNGLLGVLGR